MAASVAKSLCAAGGTSMAAGRRHAPQRRTVVVPRAAAATQEAVSSAAALVGVIKQAVSAPRSVPGPQVLQAILALEKQKLPPQGWEEAISAKGTHWKLTILAGKDSVSAAMKGDKSKSVYYWPLVAAQNFDAGKKEFENGVFLGNLAYLTFVGPYFMFEKLLTFDVTTMKVGLGPWKGSFKLKADSPLDSLPEDPQAAAVAAKKAKLPFFIYSYADGELIVGRGRGGGLAIWAKTDAQWAAENGVLQLYADK